jgi:hypothetical protein
MKAILISLALLAGLLLFPGRNKAQLIVKPGDPLLRSDLIRSSHNYYKGIFADTLGNIIDQWVNDQVISVDSATGRITFARARQVPVGSYSTDTSITDLSCKPLWMHEVHYRQDVSFTMNFDATNATVHTLRKGAASDRSYPMKSGYFEDNMIEYVYGYLDLAKGQTYTLDDFNKDAPAPSDPVSVDYAFDDIWVLNTGAMLNCRVLHFVHGAATGYIWIDKQTRCMIKELGSFQKGTFSITRI